MWKLLYQLASPKAFYTLSSRIIPWLAVISGLVLFVGLLWGLIFAPPDYQQGNAYQNKEQGDKIVAILTLVEGEVA